MSISPEGSTINIELLSETIRHLIVDHWSPARFQQFRNPNDPITPRFISLYGTGDAHPDYSKELLPNDLVVKDGDNVIRFTEGDTVRYRSEDVGPNTNYLSTSVFVDIFATTRYLRTLFADEVNRIIFEHIPSPGNKLHIPVDRTLVPHLHLEMNSRILTFDRQFIDFTEIRQVETEGITAQLTGELGCVWVQTKR